MKNKKKNEEEIKNYENNLKIAEDTLNSIKKINDENDELINKQFMSPEEFCKVPNEIKDYFAEKEKEEEERKKKLLEKIEEKEEENNLEIEDNNYNINDNIIENKNEDNNKKTKNIEETDVNNVITENNENAENMNNISKDSLE